MLIFRGYTTSKYLRNCDSPAENCNSFVQVNHVFMKKNGSQDTTAAEWTQSQSCDPWRSPARSRLGHKLRAKALADALLDHWTLPGWRFNHFLKQGPFDFCPSLSTKSSNHSFFQKLLLLVLGRFSHWGITGFCPFPRSYVVAMWKRWF